MAYDVTESQNEVSRPDVGGAFTSNGGNFIGAIDATQVSWAQDDIHGTAGQPLSAKLDSETRFKGGPMPTLKLLPGSPAR